MHLLAPNSVLKKKVSPLLDFFFHLFLILVSSFSSITLYQYAVIYAHEPLEQEELPFDLVDQLEAQKKLQEQLSPPPPLEEQETTPLDSTEVPNTEETPPDSEPVLPEDPPKDPQKTPASAEEPSQNNENEQEEILSPEEELQNPDLEPKADPTLDPSEAVQEEKIVHPGEETKALDPEQETETQVPLKEEPPDSRVQDLPAQDLPANEKGGESEEQPSLENAPEAATKEDEVENILSETPEEALKKEEKEMLSPEPELAEKGELKGALRRFKTEEEDRKPLLKGKLLPPTGGVLEEATLRLAEVDLIGKKKGEVLLVEEALLVLNGLTMREEDFEKLILIAILSEEKNEVAQAFVENGGVDETLKQEVEKGRWQSWQKELEEALNQGGAQELIAILEDEAELEVFIETLFSSAMKQGLLQGLIQHHLEGQEEAVSPAVVALGMIQQEYEKLALAQLVGKKIATLPSARRAALEMMREKEGKTSPPSSTPVDLKVTARGPGGTLLLPLNQMHFEAGSLVMKLDPMRRLTPGLYSVELEFFNPLTGKIEHLVQDLAWGVLAMNLDRDTYEPGEEANLAIGVLDDQGKPVCQAELLLEITDPGGGVERPAVQNTGGCTVLNSMNIQPDYQAFYPLVQAGEYQLQLTAKHPDGKVRTRRSTLHVAPALEGRVKRTAATRLYPVGSSPMTIEVDFKKPFSGTLTEVVPQNFELVEIDQGGELREHAKEKYITWAVQATAGEVKQFSYRYDAPDISPEFYTLGPLHGGRLMEKRRWEIANDEPVISADSTNELLGHWKFNEGFGSSTADSSSYASNGTLNNMEAEDWIMDVPPVSSNAFALDFNANNENVTVGDPVDGHLDFEDTADFTLSGWFNRDTFNTTDVILAKRNNGNTSQTGYFLYLPNSDQLIFEISDGTDEYILSSSTIFTTAGWNHFAVVWDQDNAANTEIYINGVDNNANDVGNIANIGSAANSLSLTFGGESDAGNPFDGKLDDLRVYNRVLTDSEIMVLAGSTPPPMVTDANITINAGTGTAGAFIVGSQIIVSWNNSATGDNNVGLTGVTADLSGWGGSSTEAMSDTVACGGTTGDNIYEACFTLVSGGIDMTNVKVSVTATNASGSTTTADTSNATVDNQPPDLTDNGTLTISTDNGVIGVAALNDGASNQDKVTQSAVTLALNDSDSVTIDLSALTGQATLAVGTESTIVLPGTLDSATQTFTTIVTDNAGNMSTTLSDAISADNKAPIVTAAHLSVTGATGTGGAFKFGDSATGRWDDSITGNNNGDTASAIFNLSHFRSGDTSLAGASIANIWTASLSGALDSQGDTNNNVTVTVTDDGGNLTTATGTNNYTVDTLLPTIDSITSVAGDATAPYTDSTDDGSTTILFASSDTNTGVSSCRWDTANTSYSSMLNTCDSTSSCTTNLSGTGAKTVYLACLDGAGNAMTTTTQVDYTVAVGDVTPPSGTSITPNSLRIIDSSNPSFVVDDGTDGESGINTSSRLLERAEATYTNNTCGTFGGFVGVLYSGTYPNLSDSSITGSACYKYRYSVSDNAGNSTTTDETATIVRVPFTTLLITGGNNQTYGDLNTSPIGHPFSTPLQARVTDGGSNWALAEEVGVDFAFTSVPSSPGATGQSLSVNSDNTDANGYAETTVTLGDRAGNYLVLASSTHPSVSVEPTFTATAGNYFEIDIVEDEAFINLDPLSNSTDFVSLALNLSTNAANYQVYLTPDQWPLSGLDEILNWVNPLGFGWKLNVGTVMAFLESLGNPDSTPAYSCSGDLCQGTQLITIDLHAGIDFLNPPGTYSTQITFSGEAIVY